MARRKRRNLVISGATTAPAPLSDAPPPRPRAEFDGGNVSALPPGADVPALQRDIPFSDAPSARSGTTVGKSLQDRNQRILDSTAEQLSPADWRTLRQNPALADAYRSAQRERFGEPDELAPIDPEILRAAQLDLDRKPRPGETREAFTTRLLGTPGMADDAISGAVDSFQFRPVQTEEELVARTEKVQERRAEIQQEKDRRAALREQRAIDYQRRERIHRDNIREKLGLPPLQAARHKVGGQSLAQRASFEELLMGSETPERGGEPLGDGVFTADDAAGTSHFVRFDGETGEVTPVEYDIRSSKWIPHEQFLEQAARTDPEINRIHGTILGEREVLEKQVASGRFNREQVGDLRTQHALRVADAVAQVKKRGISDGPKFTRDDLKSNTVTDDSGNIWTLDRNGLPRLQLSAADAAADRVKVRSEAMSLAIKELAASGRANQPVDMARVDEIVNYLQRQQDQGDGDTMSKIPGTDAVRFGNGDIHHVGPGQSVADVVSRDEQLELAEQIKKEMPDASWWESKREYDRRLTELGVQRIEESAR